MKRFITFSVIIMALVLGVVGIIKNGQGDISLDISDALSVIAAHNEMAKSGLVNERIVFSADDFEKSLNISALTKITVTAVPSSSDGCLCLGDIIVNEGQTISRSNLDLLNYRAASSNVRQAEFKFKVDESEYEMTCNLFFLTRENSAPTLASENERMFSVSTHQSVMAYGRIRAYDPDGDPLRYEIVSYAKNGVIDLDPETGEYTYSPIGTYFGEDSFEYVAVDKYGNYSSSKRVSLNVEKLKTDIVYSDMNGHKAHHAALTMTERGIMDGTKIGDTIYFMPDKSVSRVDFTVMLMHAIGMDECEAVSNTDFDDDDEIPQSMKGYVRAACERGIITGEIGENGEYLFSPNRAITRAEAALMISKLVNASVPTVKPMFSDRGDIPAWAHDAVYSLNALGLLESENGAISANSEITRASVAQMLCALIDMIEE